ncbi:MAG: peptidylprolyl isomerase [Pseudomonadota bacterium]
MALASAVSAPTASAQIADDPQNAVIFTVGLGYDSAADASPAQQGRVVIQLLPRFAPAHAERIKELAREGFYNGSAFHRVIDGFLAQTGSPGGDGVGGSDKPNLSAEFSAVRFERGVVGMARLADKDSANAQFFVMFEREASFDGIFTVVGVVTEGMDVLDRITRTHDFRERPLGAVPDRIISARIAAE